MSELLHSELKIEKVYAVAEWAAQYHSLLQKKGCSFEVINNKTLKRISQLTTPHQVVATAEIPQHAIAPKTLAKNYHLALDRVQDPSNLGAIIRTADWCGINHIFCSPNCVDAYNFKVVQASMGSVLRVKVHYCPLETLFKENAGCAVYGALLDGKNLFSVDFKAEKKGFILLGNESKGIQRSLLPYVDVPITIPKKGGAESLNVAIAAGIICAVANLQ